MRRRPAGPADDALGRLSGLVAYTRRVSEASSLEPILETTVEEALNLLGASSASVWFWDATHTRLTHRAGKSAASSLRVEQYPVLKRTLAGHAPVFATEDPLGKGFGGGLLLLPLLSQSQHFGLLILGFRKTVPGEEVRQLATGLAGHAGLAIANATHLGQLRSRTESSPASNSVIRGSADGILSIDGEQRITLFNPAMEYLVGYAESEVLGRTCAELFDAQTEDGGALDFSGLGQATASDEVAPVHNAAIKTRSGGRRWVGITASPEREAENHTIVVIRDISDQFELQQRQREFVAIASHELRTPITALVGYLSLLAGTTVGGSPESVRYVERAGEAARRLSELIEDLLNVARIEEGRLTFNAKPLDPAPVVEEVLRNLEPAIVRKELKVSFKNRLTGAVVKADRSKLAQILQNLIENAVKYTAPGGRITVSSRESTDGICLAIKDSGIGIRPENLSRIYEKFFREYTDLSVGAGGSGLGLFITKELVERQGGTLQITAEPHRGTRAAVRFPKAAS